MRAAGTVAAAESITSGNLAAELAAGHGAGGWFAGSIVAYSPEVKFSLLGVTRGPVITASCARQLAQAAGRLLRADDAVGTTGAGGPGAEEGQPLGTVFIAVTAAGGARVRHNLFRGIHRP
jgi:nicotinamide-nucleotide amidase